MSPKLWSATQEKTRIYFDTSRGAVQKDDDLR